MQCQREGRKSGRLLADNEESSDVSSLRQDYTGYRTVIECILNLYIKYDRQ